MSQALYFAGYLYLRGERRHPQILAQQVAVGQAEIYVSKSYKLVDIAAGSIIAKEAGAKVVDESGLDWNIKSKGLVMTVPSVFEEVQRLLQEEQFFS